MQGWPHIASGEHTLIVAPTGSGKTLAAFLWGLNQIAAARRMLAQIPDYHMFDSLAVDSEGNVCDATLITGGITIHAADGSQASLLETPDILTTNICFGGPDLKTAYITLSATGKLMSMPWHCPGLPLNFLNR